MLHPDDSQSIPKLISLDTPPPSPTPWINVVQSPVHFFNNPKKDPMKCTNTGQRQRKRKRFDWDSVSENLSLPAAPSDAPHLLQVEHNMVFEEEQCQTPDIVYTEAQSHQFDNNDNQDVDPKYAIYLEAVLTDLAHFYQISQNTFVVSGWDAQRECKNNVWYHMQTTNIGTDVVITCNCPQATWKTHTECFHERFLHEYKSEKFPDDGIFDGDAQDVHLFSRVRHDDEHTFTNQFSVLSSYQSDTNRVVVSHIGQDSGSGLWQCSKDTISSCMHITNARHFLQKVIHSDTSAQDRSTGVDVPLCDNEEPPSCIRRAARDERAVSYKTIPPPVWATLPSDPPFSRPSPSTVIPETIVLAESASCSCADTRKPQYSSKKPTFLRSCIIYALSSAYSREIQLQNCSICCRRFIGPEGSELGLFNFNNRILMTYELLDDYTSSYTMSETPFTAWVTTTARRYESQQSKFKFLTEELFRMVWFAYVKLQYLDGDMECPHCGPSPENTIWDGVTLAFNQKHLLPSLTPPSTVSDHSLVRESVYPFFKQQLLPDKGLRQTVRLVISGPSLLDVIKTMSVEMHAYSMSGDIGQALAEDKPTTSASLLKELQTRIAAIPKACEGLMKVNTGLGSLFTRNFGPAAIDDGTWGKSAYRQFFSQVTAEESVIQMTTRPALSALGDFINEPTTLNASRLVDIPSLLKLLRHEYQLYKCYSEDILSICNWIFFRGTLVLNGLIVHSSPPIQENITDDMWHKTGCCYGKPQIRLRPKYPKLKTDLQGEAANRGSNCSKYYSQYGERRLTGGLMCVWCTHSICYGFHCIPHNEGRNDVFSALLTRWEKPPKRVIYDFACALGPYCLTREADFFADTLFLIDDFHAKGHTKCSRAAFLSTYTDLDPRLKSINSSAAECGNSGLNRIRKSVSYMSQDRAILYTKVFLSIWNRHRVRALLRQQEDLGKNARQGGLCGH